MNLLLSQEEILKSQILQTAQDLYQRYGIKKVTMDDVAKAVGKTRSALYYYFKNRDELFEAVMISLVDEVKNELEEIIYKEKKLESRIQAFCIAKVKGFNKTRNFISAIEARMDSEERSKYSDIIWEIHQRMMQSETALLKRVIRESSENGEIAKPDSKNIDTLLFVLLSSIRGIRRESVSENYKDQWEEGAKMLAKMVVEKIKG
ncbi:TetR family transcriptional regulator [Chryseobacterium sp. T16E-39]|uniref:TetR/AcrR family transcriptional regulator n=1 Tax=Chryseobacterium sp. T16E-39 TaxID=2015076 RepID=UPI000B5B43FA|nr:TetR/AcrR family transcriptional regulator [Chryseobacterium sp. T16E-39]ASK32148.1 TetR family transcriptional regulator [Chryseobacterium sp. T16E-39]